MVFMMLYQEVMLQKTPMEKNMNDKLNGGCLLGGKKLTRKKDHVFSG